MARLGIIVASIGLCTAITMSHQTATAQTGSSWAGPYAGLLLTRQSAFDRDQMLYAFEPTTRVKPAILAGYNWFGGSLVFGIESEISTGGGEDARASIRGRTGYALGPALFYVAVGYAGAQNRIVSVASLDRFTFGRLTRDIAVHGAEFAVGTQIRLGAGLSARMEHQTTEFGRKFVDFGGRADLGGPPGILPTQPRDISLRLGLVYNYDARSAPNVTRAPSNWSGPNFGFRGGYHLRDHSIKEAIGDFAEFPIDIGRLQFGSFGATAGYVWQFGSLVIGAEAGANYI